MNYQGLDRLIKRSAAFRKVHQTIAARMGEGSLLCGNCGAEKKLNTAQVETYLRDGWPDCCPGTLNGGTMHYYGANDRRPV